MLTKFAISSRATFETFSIEPANGRIIQIHDQHAVTTTDDSRLEEAIGVPFDSA